MDIEQIEVEQKIPRAERGVSERALRAAIELFTLWEDDEKNIPLDRIVSGEFRTRKYLNSGERRWIAEAVYGCARFWRRQVFVLNARGQEPTPENVVRLWAEQEEEEKRRRGEEETEEGKREKGGGESVGAQFIAPNTQFIAPDTQSTIHNPSTLPSPDRPHEYLRIALSFPDEMAAALEHVLGEEAIAAAQAFNRQAPTTLRVNPLRVSWAHLRKSLPDPTPTRYSPWGLELSRRVNIYEIPGYRTGWFEVQEEASQLVALLVDAKPGQGIVEVGAGAGGKTLALAALMENKGAIFAIDVSQNRLDELQKRGERAGVTCVEPIQVDADSSGEWQPTVSKRRKINQWRNMADAVLVDAPCTGSGVLRRSPDAKWREFDLEHMTGLQSALIQQAAALVRPGGMLFYVSCAFEPAQNEDIVNAFLTTELGQQFEVVPAVPRLQAACERAEALAQTPPFLRTEKAQKKLSDRQQAEREAHEQQAQLEAGAITAASLPEPERASAAYESLASGSFLRTWPHRHGLDAFFAACLQRKAV